MLLTISLIAVLTWLWFWYTDRKNTMETTGHTLGATGTVVKHTAKAIKLEADIAKAKNEIADLEGRVHRFHGTKSGIKAGKEFLNSLSLDDTYFTKTQSELESLQNKITELKG